MQEVDSDNEALTSDCISVDSKSNTTEKMHTDVNLSNFTSGDNAKLQNPSLKRGTNQSITVLPKGTPSTGPDSSDEEPEWDDDTNPWLGCVCGETHKSPTPVFWIQCEGCDAWYNCASECVGFNKKKAKEMSSWECPGCAPFEADLITEKQPVTEDIMKTPTMKVMDGYSDRSHHSTPLAVGTVVDVEDRTYSGSNKPGGVAKIEGFRRSTKGILYDVKYVVHRGRETNLESIYVKLAYGFTMPRNTRSAEKEYTR